RGRAFGKVYQSAVCKVTFGAVGYERGATCAARSNEIDKAPGRIFGSPRPPVADERGVIGARAVQKCNHAPTFTEWWWTARTSFQDEGRRAASGGAVAK